MLERLKLTSDEFDKRFQTEEDCVRFIRETRWPHDFVCPKCGHDDGYELHDIRLIQCAVCRKQVSVLVGTIFQGTHMRLTAWFKIIYAMAEDKGGASSSRLSKQLGIPQKTVWSIMDRIRSAMSSRLDEVRLGGDIELDEVHINKEARKYQDESGTQTKVLVMVETEGKRAGEIIARVTPAATAANIRISVEDFTVEDSQHHFRTDGWHAHYELRRMGHNLDIRPLPGKLAVEKLPWVHTFASLIRRYLMGTYHGISPMRLQAYLDEFCFRVNRRFRPATICISLLKACVYAPLRKLAY